MRHTMRTFNIGVTPEIVLLTFQCPNKVSKDKKTDVNINNLLDCFQCIEK